jgi:hypothetical protein
MATVSLTTLYVTHETSNLEKFARTDGIFISVHMDMGFKGTLLWCFLEANPDIAYVVA